MQKGTVCSKVVYEIVQSRFNNKKFGEGLPKEYFVVGLIWNRYKVVQTTEQLCSMFSKRVTISKVVDWEVGRNRVFNDKIGK